MREQGVGVRFPGAAIVGVGLVLAGSAILSGQLATTGARDPAQVQDESFAASYREWTGEPKYGSPLVDHLPIVNGVPTPKDVIGYHVGAPRKLTYYADMLKYYRALAAATPRVVVETIGRSDEGRELVVVWVSSEENLRSLRQNRENLAKIADPRGLTEEQVRRLIATTRPGYHVIGGLHSGETGASEMLMELVYRLAVETSPIISRIRDNVYVSVTPVADADGRDRMVDWFYYGLEAAARPPSGVKQDAASPPGPLSGGKPEATSPPGPPRAGGAGRVEPVAAGTGTGRAGAGQSGRVGAGQAAAGGTGTTETGRAAASPIGSLPYWGKYVFHDNNRDINIALMQMRALTDWYYTAHPPIMHDLHESMALMYTYSGGPPQNPNLDPLLFAELSWFSNWELAQMTKWGMPGVYTHAFMDGWSPGYLGSVAYNHNGVMKMYETQSGRDPAPEATRPAAGEAPLAGAVVRSGKPATPVPATGGTRPAPPAGAARAPATARTAGVQPPPPAQAGTPQPPPVAAAPPPVPATGGRGAPAGAAGRGSAVPTGRGGSQDREWYRGIPVPPNAAATFSRRANANYSQTGVLSSLQLTAMFPDVVLENFYVKTRNSIEAGKSRPPHGFVIPVQRDMTKAAELVRILRVQGIEVGVASGTFTIGNETHPAGSWIIKLDQPYGRLAKNLLERQVYPDARLTTYDDSGWTMGLAMLVEVKQVADPAILNVPTTQVIGVASNGRLAGGGTAGLAVAHVGSNNMITFRYRLPGVSMRIAERGFTAEGIEFPPGSFVVPGPVTADARAAVEELGLTAAALGALPAVPMHDADAPRVAIYSQWTSTQDLGWYRLTFDRLGIPYDLVYKEQVRRGELAGRYDVIVMAAQSINRQAVLQAPASSPQPYMRSEKYRFLGMYGETPDMSGGFGPEGVEAFRSFLEAGGTIIAAGNAIRFPIEFGWARTVDAEQASGVTAQRPIVEAEIVRPDHPTFYGYSGKTMPMKYVGGNVLRVGVADEGHVLGRYVGGDASVLSGLMVGAEQLRQRAFAVDLPRVSNGKGRVILFASNPVYRWQNHGEFNLVFNSLLNWNDVPPELPPTVGATSATGGRGAQGSAASR